jgi:hypothetical protein
MPTLDFTNRPTLEEFEKLPRPTNDNLNELFFGVDTVVIKESGVHQNRALSDNIVLTLSHFDIITKFQSLLEIIEPTEPFYCMCLGDYAIELIVDNKITATLGFHHGYSIRYDNWYGDSELAKRDEFLDFLAKQGLTKPLIESLEAKRNMEADRIIERKWLDNAPACFSKYWTEINGFDNNYLSSLIADLNREIPKREKQIIILLQTFGRTDNFWSGYPIYEELPNEILKTFDIKEIILVYLQSDRNYKTRKGLGRFLCSFEFKKIRKKHLTHIPKEVIDDLEKCFNSRGEQRGINEIFKLRNEKKQQLT